MMKITLPVLPSDMALKDALDVLRDRHVSGLVTNIAGRPTVLDTDALLRGPAVAETILGRIVPTHRTIDFDKWEPNLGAVGDQDRAAAMLDNDDARFGVAGPVSLDGDIVLVITRSERFAEELGLQMASCVCTGPGRHVCAPGDALVRGECNDCSSPLNCS